MNRSSLQFSSENFHRLLRWLDSDEQHAAEKYETIRQRLVKLFAWQHCSDPEELADETMTRVARRIQEIATSYQGEPSYFFYGMAKSVLRDYFRHARKPISIEHEFSISDIDKDENREQLYACLDECMLTLTPDNRELLMTYYENYRRARINAGQQLARQLGLTAPALRVRLFRIRTQLEKCIEHCMNHNSDRK